MLSGPATSFFALVLGQSRPRAVLSLYLRTSPARLTDPTDRHTSHGLCQIDGAERTGRQAWPGQPLLWLAGGPYHAACAFPLSPGAGPNQNIPRSNRRLGSLLQPRNTGTMYIVSLRDTPNCSCDRVPYRLFAQAISRRACPPRDLSYTDLKVFCFVPRLVGCHVRSLHRQPALCNQHGRLRWLGG